MKHNDKAFQSDSSARLDALLSDFLNKDIVVSSEQQSSSHPTTAPLGDLFADVGSAGKPPEQATSMQPPAEAQKVAPVNRTEVWEPTKLVGSLLQSQLGLENLAADRLEKEVNSVLEASESTGSGKKLLVGSVAIILVLAAGLLIWQSRSSRSSEEPSEEPAVHLSPSEVDAPPSTETAPPTASVSEAALGPSEAVAINPNTVSHEKRPVVPVLVPESSAATSAASATQGVSQSIAQNAAKLQRMPAPTLLRPNVPLGAIQNIPTLQSAQPPAPLPLPPNPASSTVKPAVPEAIRTTTATPALPVTKVQPIYPELARRMKVTGTVHVAIVVDTTGKVISAKAVDGATVLRGSAELAVKQWRFKPATMNGMPVTGSGTVSVVFNPDRR
jgi:periplasmic protein TonB